MAWWEWVLAPIVTLGVVVLTFGPGLWMLWDYEKNHGGFKIMNAHTTPPSASGNCIYHGSFDTPDGACPICGDNDLTE